MRILVNVIWYIRFKNGIEVPFYQSAVYKDEAHIEPKELLSDFIEGEFWKVDILHDERTHAFHFAQDDGFAFVPKEAIEKIYYVEKHTDKRI